MNETFKALVMDQQDGRITTQIRDMTPASLPGGDVTINVEYSSLNYKDGLAVTGTGKIIRQFPMTPGIDLAGTVEHSLCDSCQPGDRVLVTGFGIGERYPGGYAQKNRVRTDWIVKIPEGMTSRQAMSIGTAGFTSMLCIMALEHQGVVPSSGEVLVTGAGGGVGSIAVAILAKLGYTVAASTGRPEVHDYLKSLGASTVVERATFTEVSKKPMEAERWAGAVDSVGGITLSNVLKGMKYGGSVAACGLAGGADVPATVFPFILRGVNLLGIDSVYCKIPKRVEAWRRLSEDLPLGKLEQMTRVISLGEVERYSRDILAGKVQGRIVVDVNA